MLGAGPSHLEGVNRGARQTNDNQISPNPSGLPGAVVVYFSEE